MSGWIAVTRSSFDHPAFKRSEVSEAEAWHRLIARAAHAKTRHRIKAEVVEVERGSFFCTLRELQSEFMWRSDARVRNFLRMLENERMIERKTNAGKTHVTICNYNEYQAGERTENAKNTQARTQAERKPNALNNKETIKQGSTSVERTRAPVPVFPDFIRPEIAAAFIEHRKAKRAKLTPRAVTLLSKNLETIQAMGIDANDALDLAISRNWTTVEPEWAARELKGTANEPHRNNQRQRTASTGDQSGFARALERAAAKEWAGAGGDTEAMFPDADRSPCEGASQPLLRPEYGPSGRGRISGGLDGRIVELAAVRG
jgi:hypothetical protein